jgi:hypothetical protein
MPRLRHRIGGGPVSTVIDQSRPGTSPLDAVTVLIGGILNQGKTASRRLSASSGCAVDVSGLWAAAGCLVCGCTPDQCGPGGGCAHPLCCIDHYPLPAVTGAGTTGGVAS